MRLFTPTTKKTRHKKLRGGAKLSLNDLLALDRADELERYRQLHAGLSEMIKNKRLTEKQIPTDYAWLVKSLEDLTNT